ncbi:hypothetical protein NM688_g3337 [Phlebia brevispora]|uniref:Uncharacterized protein n=1 Tax=Phlebia brevispora TaxID=194682 RepID=A0ACC1T5Z7_9APHY|nr:hypothetical protein NM688_g3337 [Phlebia brevispora]
MDNSLTYHTFLDFPDHSFFSMGIIVPQKIYTALVPFQAQPSIAFVENGHMGVRLENALNNHFEALEDPASTPLVTDKSRVMYRVLWPGYEPWSDSSHIVDNSGLPISRARLAFSVARIVQKFMSDVRYVGSSELRPDWWVENVRYDALYLVELRHVSTGSWQPVLRLAF